MKVGMRHFALAVLLAAGFPSDGASQIGILLHANLRSQDQQDTDRFKRGQLMVRYLEARIRALDIRILNEVPERDLAWEITVDVAPVTNGIYAVAFAVCAVRRDAPGQVTRGEPIIALLTGRDLADVARDFAENDVPLLIPKSD